MSNNGSRLEDYVQYVYSTLLNLKGEQIVVSRGAFLFGKREQRYKMDVYYEFKKAGIIHRVVIECKDKGRAIERDEVLTFKGKIDEIGQLRGVMVSKNGYQSGAKEYADDHDILLLTEKELPHIGSLLASRLEAVCLPDEMCIGEPFWTLMEVKNNRLTGDYFTMVHADNIPRVPLFISKKHAAVFHTLNKETKSSYVIRGIPQYVLRSLIIMIKFAGAEVALIYDVPKNYQDSWQARSVTPQELKEEFLLVDLDLSKAKQKIW